jgi:hypothetical protein
VTLQVNCSGTWTSGGVCSPNTCPIPTCCKGDTNLDGVINGLDIQEFVLVRINGYDTTAHGCACDMNSDTVIDDTDQGLFVNALLTGATCP